MERFVSPPSAAQEWAEFEGALATALTGMIEDEYLIISRKQTDYFVQFAAQGAFGMRAEAVSNAYIQRPAPLSAQAGQQLLDLGWYAPTYTPGRGREPADGSPNYYIDAAPPVPFDAVARLAVQSLRAVYGVRHPGELQYSAMSADGDPRQLPILKIKEEGG